MDGEKKEKNIGTGDPIVDLALNGLPATGKEKTQNSRLSGKIMPKDFFINAFSTLLIMGVTALINLFISPEVEYTQKFTWTFSILLVVNWIAGVVSTYFSRRSAIDHARLLPEYISSESKKQEAFKKIGKIAVAQKLLDQKMMDDFIDRREALCAALAKLLEPKMPKNEDGTVKEWKLGDPLPDKAPKKAKKLKKTIETMTPSHISLFSLSESEVTYSTASLYDIPANPEKTGSLWFVRKGVGKVGWFAIWPILLSIICDGLAVGITIGNVVYTLGVMGAMLFNIAREYALSYYVVSHVGIARNNRITSILNDLAGEKQEKPIDNM